MSRTDGEKSGARTRHRDTQTHRHTRTHTCVWFVVDRPVESGCACLAEPYTKHHSLRSIFLPGSRVWAPGLVGIQNGSFRTLEVILNPFMGAFTSLSRSTKRKVNACGQTNTQAENVFTNRSEVVRTPGPLVIYVGRWRFPHYCQHHHQFYQRHEHRADEVDFDPPVFSLPCSQGAVCGCALACVDVGANMGLAT